MGEDDDPDAPDAVEDWVGAQEHGEALEEYILESDEYTAVSDAERDAGGVPAERVAEGETPEPED